MFVDQLTAAIEAARSIPRLDDLARTMWQGYRAQALDDDAVQALDERIRCQRMALKGLQEGPGRPLTPSAVRPSIFPPKRPQRSPDRTASRHRRRRHARARWMPDQIAALFSDGELAALSIIAEEHASHRACDLPVGKIAALAGVSPSTVRNALREARRSGLISVEERARPGRPHLPNVVRITSVEWRLWIDRRPASRMGRGGGCKDLQPSLKNNILNIYTTGQEARRTGKKGYRKGGAAADPPGRARF